MKIEVYPGGGLVVAGVSLGHVNDKGFYESPGSIVDPNVSNETRNEIAAVIRQFAPDRDRVRQGVLEYVSSKYGNDGASALLKAQAFDRIAREVSFVK